MEHQLLAIRSHVEVSSAFHFQGATYHWCISFRHGLLDPVWPVRAYQYVQPRWFEIRPTLHSFSFRCLLLLSTFFVVLYQYSICGLGDSFFFLPAESEESDEEDGTGNVTRMVMRPPGHSGKAKKGHLCLDASFETGKCWEFSLCAAHQLVLLWRVFRYFRQSRKSRLRQRVWIRSVHPFWFVQPSTSILVQFHHR